jgi:thiol-disulfide isomerase/thioredoxin
MRGSAGPAAAVLAVVLAVALTGSLAGCGRTPEAAQPAAASAGAAESTGASTAAVTGPPCVPASPSPIGVVTNGPPLSDLSLPCLTDGAPVRLAYLGRPAIVNLWASWCGPCREELPAFQRYADRAAGSVLVLGVITEDTRAAAQSFVDDYRLTFPMLYDREGQLKRAVGKVALPITVFLDGRGQVAYVYNAEALTEANIELLAERHLAVVVPR